VKPSGRHRRLRVAILSAALGLSVWGAAFTFTQASFSEGDVLSAASLNALLNDNFQAASDAIDAKLGVAGGTVTGRLSVAADAALSQEFLDSLGIDLATSLFVANTASTGSAATFLAESSDEAPAVFAWQQGNGTAMTLKAAGSGDLIQAFSPPFSRAIPAFSVQNDGTVSIESANASLTLHAATGTIENQDGSGIPLAHGTVDGKGDKLGGTTNWTSSQNDTGIYTIDLPVDYNEKAHAVTLTPVQKVGDDPVALNVLLSNGGDLVIQARNTATGAPVDTTFTFVVHAVSP